MLPSVVSVYFRSDQPTDQFFVRKYYPYYEDNMLHGKIV
jgi:hypothetical protein